MKEIKVKDLMVLLDDYATVHQDATLRDAILALEKAQKAFQKQEYTHRAVLAVDDDRQVVGKLGMIDVLRALEPKYSEMGSFRSISHIGFDPEFIRSMIDKYELWQHAMEQACERASLLRVREIMYRPTAGELVSTEATLDEAIHHIVVGHHQSLLAVENGRVVGVLRLADVFAQICKTIKACKA